MNNKEILVTTCITILSTYCAAMDGLSQRKSSLTGSPAPRPQSPTQLQLYLPSNKMEPHRSISQQNLAQLETVLNEGDGWRLQLRSSSGHSPLEYAIQVCFIDGIRTLLQKGASPLVINEETGEHGFHIAARHATGEVIALLMVHTAFGQVDTFLKEAQTKLRAIPDPSEQLFQEAAKTLTILHLSELSDALSKPNMNMQTPTRIVQERILESASCTQISPDELNPLYLEKYYGESITKHYLAILKGQ